MKPKMSTGVHEFRLFTIIGAIFTAALITSNVASSAKIIAFGPLTFPAGAILFPITFIFGDILTEVYGYARSRVIIWTGFGCLLLATATFYLGQILPSAPFWTDQAAYDRVLGLVPRIALASITAYFFGEFANSYVLSRMKYFNAGKRGFSQAWRFIASTLVGEGVDSVIFMLVAFLGVLSVPQMMLTGGTLYVFKVLYEIIATPVSTRFANWVKRIEGLDELDCPETTRYNPFAIFFESRTSTPTGTPTSRRTT